MPVSPVREPASDCRRRPVAASAWAGCLLAVVLGASAGDAPEAASRPVAATAPDRSTWAALPDSFDRAIIIPIEDEITDITLKSIERRLDQVKAQGVRLVVFELNTPGGALSPTLDICTLIRDLRSQGTSSVAWINKKAYSAGTIIALATDGIVMARHATIGDCKPIMVTGLGADEIPEGLEAKAISPLLKELRDSAREGGYPLTLVMALVREEMRVFWLENVKTRERRFVEAHERDRLFGLEPVAEPEAGRGGDKSKTDPAPADRVEPVPDSRSKTDWRYVKQDPLLGEVHQPIVGGRELLTVGDKEALAYGFSRATLDGREDLASFLHVTGPIDRIERTYMESFVAWLASPLVRSVLFILMMMGAYAEFHTPGLSLGGAVALIALVLFLGAPYLAGYTVTWEIVAVVLGLVLIGVEILLIPGFGVTGLVGILLLVLGLVASFVPAEPPTPGRQGFHMPELPLTYDYLRHGLYSLAAGLTGSIFGMVVLARYLPRVPLAGRIIAPNPEHDAVQAADPYLGVVAPGDVGRAETLLRPAGKARFGDRLVDVVSLGEYIEAGERVEVIERRGSRVVVRRAG